MKKMNPLEKLAAKRKLANLIKEANPDNAAGITVTQKGAPGGVKTAPIKTPGGEGSVKSVPVQKYQAAAKLIQGRPKVRFGSLLGAKADDTPRNRAIAAERKRAKTERRSNYEDQMKRLRLFGSKSLQEGWKPPTAGKDGRPLTGMQRDYIASLGGKPAKAHLTASGEFIKKKKRDLRHLESDRSYAQWQKKQKPSSAPAPAVAKAAPAKPKAPAAKHDWANMGYKQRVALKKTMSRKEWRKGMNTWWNARKARRRLARAATPTAPPAT
tara:strand:+ start:8420 stop:9226 length:807 start_codon:yes stop_codon:yes gene_type:complete